ncbi:hypothetical protein QVD17_24146 [Tagetes erecta]|uniref:Uncharacterized protein n=1 Tax=Tagetes erecta TaxID=13708 RepID=A0AAD8NMM2_TARER|nr:hypothetical protein QVD17_24146 [Tagetes erecta]
MSSDLQFQLPEIQLSSLKLNLPPPPQFQLPFPPVTFVTFHSDQRQIQAITERLRGHLQLEASLQARNHAWNQDLRSMVNPACHPSGAQTLRHKQPATFFFLSDTNTQIGGNKGCAGDNRKR